MAVKARRKTAAERELESQLELLQFRRGDLQRQIDAITPLEKMIRDRLEAIRSAK